MKRDRSRGLAKTKTNPAEYELGLQEPRPKSAYYASKKHRRVVSRQHKAEATDHYSNAARILA